jgi:hypothetical protein
MYPFGNTSTLAFSILQRCFFFSRTPLCTRSADPAPNTRSPALASPLRHPPTTSANCKTRHRHSPQAPPPPTDPCTSCPPLLTSPTTPWWNAPQGRWLRCRGRGIAPGRSPPKEPATRLRPWKPSARAARKRATHTTSGARTSGPSGTRHLARRDWTKLSPPGGRSQPKRPTFLASSPRALSGRTPSVPPPRKPPGPAEPAPFPICLRWDPPAPLQGGQIPSPQPSPDSPCSPPRHPQQRSRPFRIRSGLGRPPRPRPAFPLGPSVRGPARPPPAPSPTPRAPFSASPALPLLRIQPPASGRRLRACTRTNPRLAPET